MQVIKGFQFAQYKQKRKHYELHKTEVLTEKQGKESITVLKMTEEKQLATPWLFVISHKVLQSDNVTGQAGKHQINAHSCIMC